MMTNNVNINGIAARCLYFFLRRELSVVVEELVGFEYPHDWIFLRMVDYRIFRVTSIACLKFTCYDTRPRASAEKDRTRTHCEHIEEHVGVGVPITSACRQV